VSDAKVWHINADEAEAFEYARAGFDAQSLKLRYRPDPFRSSDHDPLMLALRMPATPLPKAQSQPANPR
jgi:predicted extracellular nuclease